MKAKVLISVVVIIALVVGFILLRPHSTSTQPQTKAYSLVVKERRLVSGPSTLSATQGDRVSVTITVDEDEELHVHGYDKKLELEKDKPATLSFTANLTGDFPYELEHSSTELGSLQVQPK